MTKTEAKAMGLCERACGLYCKASKKCNGDMFAGRDKIGYLVTVKSEKCSLTDDTIKRMKLEYGYNPRTGKINSWTGKKAGSGDDR